MPNKSKCGYPLNELFRLNGEKLDVSKLLRQHKICYYPDIDSVVIKHNILVVKGDVALPTYGKFEVLSPEDAPKRYPLKFFNPGKGAEYESKNFFMVSLKLKPEEILFCRKHGAVATYIKGLIRAEMKKEDFKTDELQSTI